MTVLDTCKLTSFSCGDCVKRRRCLALCGCSCCRGSSVSRLFACRDRGLGVSLLHHLNFVKVDCVSKIVFLNVLKLRSRLSHGRQMSWGSPSTFGSGLPYMCSARARISLLVLLNRLYRCAGSPTDLHSRQQLLFSKFCIPYTFVGVFFCHFSTHILLKRYNRLFKNCCTWIFGPPTLKFNTLFSDCFDVYNMSTLTTPP